MQQGTKADYRERSEGGSSKRTWAFLFAALWLDAIVIIYIALQLTRVATPVQDWLPRVIELFGL